MKAMLIHLDKLHVAIAFSSQDHHVGVRVVEGDQDSRRHVQVQLVLVIMTMVNMWWWWWWSRSWWWSWSWWWSCKKRLITLESMLTQMKTTWTTLGLRRSLRINCRALSPEFRFNNCQHDLNWLCGASMTRALYTIYSLWILYGHLLYSIYVISSVRIRPSYIPSVNM